MIWLADRQLLAVEMRNRTVACLWSVSDRPTLEPSAAVALTMRREFFAFLLAVWQLRGRTARHRKGELPLIRVSNPGSTIAPGPLDLRKAARSKETFGSIR